MQLLLDRFRKHTYLHLGFLLLLATLLYVLGIKYSYLIIAVFFIALTMPLPAVFDSLLSKLVPSLLIFFGIYQIVATIQLFLFSDTGFAFAAVLTTIFLLIFGYLFTPTNNNIKVYTRPKKLFSSNDIACLIAVLLLVIPFVGLLFKGGDMYQNIAQLGGIQAIDGANHWNQLYSNSFAESIRYDRGNYFPAGFHITTAFVQDSWGLNPNETDDWRTNSLVFILHYVLMSAALIVLSIFFIFGLIKQRISNQQRFIVVFATVPSLAALFIIPFIYNGFLNHIYMCAVVLLAALMLVDKYVGSTLNGSNRTYMYYIVAYGAVMSWPLIAPPLILAPLLLAINRDNIVWEFNRSLLRKIQPYALGTMLLAVPVLIQYFTSPVGPTSSILLEGGLKVWHVGIYFVCAIFMVWLIVKRNVSSRIYDLAVYGFSFLLLIVGLAALQFFAAGEVRYYTIKTSSFLELIILLVFVLGAVIEANKIKSFLSTMITICVIPIIMLLAISLNDNPLKDVRSMFRSYSQEQKPPYFEEDINALLKPAVQNEIDYSDYMTLHYQAESGKIFAHPQIPFWFSAMNKDVVKSDDASGCLRDTYKILLFGNYTPDSQIELKRTINKCANIVGRSDSEYTILTDKESLLAIESMFSDNRNIRVVAK